MVLLPEMILYFLWIDVSKHGLFCHDNCSTLTSLYLCVWLACKPVSPGVSRATGLKLITPCQCGKLLWGYFHWLVMTRLWPAIWVLLSLSSNCQHKRKQKGDSCEVGTYSPWAQRGHRASPPPRILHEWYHFVQWTPLINNRDVNAL